MTDRVDAANDISAQILASLATLPDAVFQQATPFGDRYVTEMLLAGPNGRWAGASVIWQVNNQGTTLVTLWLRPHNRRQDEGESL